MGSSWKIVIADRGWVYIGKPTRDGDHLVINDCYNIMRWGTTSGLGELALEGPKENTKLDWYGVITIHILAVPGGTIECDDVVWNAWFAKQKVRRK